MRFFSVVLIAVAALALSGGARAQGQSQVALATIGMEARRPAPDNEMLVKMIRNTLSQIATAVHSNEYAGIWTLASKGFRDKYDQKAMQAAFQHLAKFPLDFHSALVLAPVFDEQPSLNDNGELRLVGRVMTRPLTLVFQMKFAGEKEGWRLSGLVVGGQEAPPVVAAVAPATVIHQHHNQLIVPPVGPQQAPRGAADAKSKKSALIVAPAGSVSVASGVTDRIAAPVPAERPDNKVASVDTSRVVAISEVASKMSSAVMALADRESSAPFSTEYRDTGAKSWETALLVLE